MATPTPKFRFAKRFSRWMKKKSLSQSVAALLVELAGNLTLGDVIPGSGGLRKVRMAGGGRGKSGGFRVVYTVVVDSTWLVLLDGYSKSDQEDLTADELDALRRAAAEIVADIRSESGSQGSSEAE